MDYIEFKKTYPSAYMVIEKWAKEKNLSTERAVNQIGCCISELIPKALKHLPTTLDEGGEASQAFNDYRKENQLTGEQTAQRIDQITNIIAIDNITLDVNIDDLFK